jgi:hypothetical protein
MNRGSLSRVPAVAWRADRGQALVECLILCALLVPLWLGVQRIARWQDLQAAVVQQARHLGMSVTLSPAMNGTGPIIVDDVAPMAAVSVRADIRRDPLTDAPLLAEAVATHQDIERAVPRGVAGSAQTAALALLRPVEALSPGRLDWREDSVVRARVEADVALTVGLPGVPVVRRRWRETFSVLAGDGSLPGPWEVAARTDSLLPQSPLDLAHHALQPVRGVLGLLEPSIRGLCARRVDSEQVPADRLQRSAASSGGLLSRRWTPRC